MDFQTYSINREESPILALALHDGHFIPEALLPNMKLADHERFREEDPYTGYMARLPVNQVIVHSSRFLVDMNRLEGKAIYKDPEDAWGLTVWDSLPPSEEKKMLSYYRQFYKDIQELIESLIKHYGYFLILDIHSYNHRRESYRQEAPLIENPEINVGTRFNAEKWNPLVQHFIHLLSHATIAGKQPDVRENIKFKGGGFSQWVNQHYSEHGCVLSVEFKKTFMDEWTGRADIDHILDINRALFSTLGPLEEQLKYLSA
jgi:N-formylglutamate deformylase